jgi:hypothetical protein
MEQKKNEEIGQMRQQLGKDLQTYREAHPGASLDTLRALAWEKIPPTMDRKEADALVKMIVPEKTTNFSPEFNTFRELEKNPEEMNRYKKFKHEIKEATTIIKVGKGEKEAKLSSDQKRHIKDIEKRANEAEKKAGEMENEEEAERARTIRDDAKDLVIEKGLSGDQAWKEAEKGNPAKASKAGQDRYESYLKRNSKKDTPEEKAKFEKKTGYKVGAEGGEGATSAAPKFELTKFAPDEEAKFQKEMRGSEWYKEFVKRYGEEPDLDTDVYDTRRAWKLGIKPVRDKYDENSLHWPDKDPKGQWLKNPQKHPTAWMQDFMEEFGYNPEEKGITKEQYRKMTKRKASKGGSEKKSGNTGELKGNKITVGGKQYDVKDGMFTMDGKKYKVTK